MHSSKLFSVLCLALLASVCLASAALAGADPVINEFVRDHTGTDIDEYVEIFGSPGTDYSSFSVIEIEGEGTGKGLIDEVFAVGTTDASGLFLIDIDPVTDSLENGTNTILLVDGFTGVEGDDVDTDDDGVIDAVFWTAIVDGIAIEDGSNPGDDTFYIDVVLTPDFDGGIFDVGGASRIPNGVDNDLPSDFVRNDFDGAGLPCCDPGTPEDGEALNTPGTLNEVIVGGGPTLEVTGSCPGMITIAFSGGTPGAPAGIIFSPMAGSDALAGGPCAGEVTELTNPQLFTVITQDGAGGFSIDRNAPSAACGLNLQIVDGGTCAISNLDMLP